MLNFYLISLVLSAAGILFQYHRYMKKEDVTKDVKLLLALIVLLPIINTLMCLALLFEFVLEGVLKFKNNK